MSHKSRIRIMFWDRECREKLYYPGHAHGFLCAPARSGKFTCTLAYMLGDFAGSCLVIDPKGQACAVTARWRRQHLGQKVYRIDPFNLLPTLPGVKWCPPLAQFDPMATLSPKSRTFAADADNVAEACLPYSQVNDPHWIDGGRMLVSGVVMALKARWPKETLVTVYRVVSGPDLFLFAQDACEWAATNGGGQFIVERLARYAAQGASENKETLCMVSAAATALQFIGNTCIAESLSGSTLNFEAMKREKITSYLILPGEYLGGNCMKWFRLVAASFTGAMMREPSRQVPVLGIFDEYKSAVGKVGVIEAAMGLGAGYGFQLVPVLQDLNQLRELHPEGWETFLANSGFRIFFAPRDKTTSDYVSDMAGDMEVRSVAKSLSEDRRTNETQVNLSFVQHSRKYLLPYETRDLGDGEALIFGENIPGVIRSGRLPYYLGKEFRFDPDPYEFGRRR